MSDIKTFEELVKSIEKLFDKKLSVDTDGTDAKWVQVTDELEICNNRFGSYLKISEWQVNVLPKSPQKIYNIIKTILEYENEK